MASFDPHEAPTRAYSSSTSGLRLAIGRSEHEAESVVAPVADEVPTMPEMPAASPTLAPSPPQEPAQAPPAESANAEAAPAEALADEGAFFEAPPRYTATSIVPPPPVAMDPPRAPRLVAKLLFAALGAGVLLLGAAELAVACLR